MRLINPHKVDFDEVWKNYLKFNKFTDEYTKNLLHSVNSSYGTWINATIPLDSLGDLILPFHTHNSDKVIIPKIGERLNNSYYRLFVKERKKHCLEHPICYGQTMMLKNLIEEGKLGAINTFFFSFGPFKSWGGAYENMPFNRNKIIHLDGLHRLLALFDISPKKRPKRINSYLALKENFFEVFKNG